MAIHNLAAEGVLLKQSGKSDGLVDILLTYDQEQDRQDARQKMVHHDVFVPDEKPADDVLTIAIRTTARYDVEVAHSLAYYISVFESHAGHMPQSALKNQLVEFNPVGKPEEGSAFQELYMLLGIYNLLLSTEVKGVFSFDECNHATVTYVVDKECVLRDLFLRRLQDELPTTPPLINLYGTAQQFSAERTGVCSASVCCGGDLRRGRSDSGQNPTTYAAGAGSF